ncbi:ATP-binding protein [Micromonospora orduensis]|uniref:ATP-binding protein n=1 Tax=Micromonospora orduensis TaxID=1420891 RepID=A0A5C4QNQ7_9ACTN|nr:ATP-binding protein [Micromonospora orduensis]TNH28645.1 ATP-binding protein [Micromonospora orduensis]
MTWAILRDFTGGSTRISVTGSPTPEAESHLSTVLLHGRLDAPLTLEVDLNGLPTSDVAPLVTVLERWATSQEGGPRLTLSANPLTPTGRLLRATLGRHPVLGTALLDHPSRRTPSDPRRAHLCLPADPQSPAAARKLVARHCRTWGMETVVDRAMVVTSELISNAVLHARTDIDITVTAMEKALRISVRDRAADAPHAAAPTAASQVSEGGRGLPIIAALTTRWGFFAFGDGKTVWAVIDNG